METLLSRTILDNPLRDLLIVAGVILAAYLLRRFTGRYLVRLVSHLFRQAGWRLEGETFSQLVLEPAGSFLFVLVAYLSLGSLRFPKALGVRFLRTDTQGVLEAVGSAVVIFHLFRMLLRTIDYVAMQMERRADLTPDQSDNQLVVFFKDFLKIIVAITGLLVMLRFSLNQDVTKILAGLSLIGAAIALAARESLENLIASFIIFFDKPFITGELLKVNNITGTVERIGLRSTRIRTVEKTYVTVPNKQMVDSIVDNLTQRTQRRAEVRLALDPRSGEEAIRGLIGDIEGMMDGLGIAQRTVLLVEITPEAYLLQCEYFTDDTSIEAFNRLRQEVNLRVISLMASRGLRIAAPERAAAR